MRNFSANLGAVTHCQKSRSAASPERDMGGRAPIHVPAADYGAVPTTGHLLRFGGEGLDLPVVLPVPSSTTTEFTTVMVRNVPRSTSLTALVAEFDTSGFAGLYDFVYMPALPKTGKNFGYAFVNFTSAWMAADFLREWHKTQRLGMQQGNYILNVTVARTQGFDDNLAMCGKEMKKADGSSKGERCKPLVLRAVSTDAAATSSAEASAASPEGLATAKLAGVSQPTPNTAQPEEDVLLAPSPSTLPMPLFIRAATARGQ